MVGDGCAPVLYEPVLQQTVLLQPVLQQPGRQKFVDRNRKT